MQEVREHWSGRLGFILAAIGSAIGLGVLWKFPYTVGANGGGLFLFVYIFCILLVGVPLFIAELFLGRATSRASISAFKKLSPSGNWKIAGYFGALTSFLIMSFYSVIAGYGMSYIVMSLTGAFQDLTPQEVVGAYRDLANSGSTSLFWHFMFTSVTVGIVMSGVRKGIEFWTRIMTRALFLILMILFVKALFLPGFHEAVRFIFYPDFKNFSMGSALEALGLAFFTLSLAQGIMISYGSYMRKEENIPQMSLIVAVSVILVSCLAALTIFPVVFSYGFEPAAGPGLIFETLPYLFAQMPGSLLFSTIFFTLFVFTALTSAIPFIEVVATNIMELTNLPRRKAVLMTGAATFLFGIPSAVLLFPNWREIYGNSFLETVDQIVSVWLIPVGGLLTAFFVGYVVDPLIVKKELGASRLYRPWRFFMRTFIPIVIILIILQKSGIIN